MTITFGTDGWRAVISDEFTFANVRLVAQAIAEQTRADLITANGMDVPDPPAMVVGFDTRFLSDRYAADVAEVLAANGFQVWLAQADAPTPMISYAIVEKQAVGGVMITASHNPPRYNGIKLKSAHGGSTTSTVAKAVERRVHANIGAGKQPVRMDLAEAVEHGLIRRFDPFPAYEAHVRKLVDFERIRGKRIAVAVDAMYGAGRIYIRRLLEDAGCTVTEMRSEMNPGFNGIHPEPIKRHLRPLIEVITNGEYHVGLATDGDADRIGAVDPDGRFIDPHGIMALLLEYLVHDRRLSGSVVKTVSTTQILNRLAERYALTLHETPVGFNHISDLMLQENVLLGGEESGGISIAGHIPEGDGVLMGLLLVEMIAARGRTLGQLLDDLMAAPDIGRFCYARLDQPVRPFDKAELVKGLVTRAPAEIGGVTVARVSDRDGVKFTMDDNSWLLIRPSGTEPVLRIYAEAGSDDQVQVLLRSGTALAQDLLEKAPAIDPLRGN